ncbi:hypothetical protein [Thermococcus sp. P6]|nr:hypothetical protein [Thermococcus sp. P6]
MRSTAARKNTTRVSKLAMVEVSGQWAEEHRLDVAQASFLMA